MDKIRKPDVWADFANAVGLLSAAKCPNLAILADRDPNGHGCFWCSQRQRLLEEYQSTSKAADTETKP